MRPVVACAALLVGLAACGGGRSGERLAATWTEPTTGMEFLLIRPGTFDMGLRADEPGDLRAAPLHTVTLSEPFYLGRFEVTQKQWLDVMGSRPSRFHTCGGDCPVETVSWGDAQDFLRRLEAANPEETFRLPTEAEWEYACRTGAGGRYGSLDTLRPELANFDGRIPFDGVVWERFTGEPTPVGSFPPNRWGLHDVQGNVWEWVQDEYCPYGAGAVVDPVGSCGTDTIPIRGGSFYFSANAARCGRRYTHARNDKGFSLGFRVVRVPPRRTDAEGS